MQMQLSSAHMTSVRNLLGINLVSTTRTVTIQFVPKNSYPFLFAVAASFWLAISLNFSAADEVSREKDAQFQSARQKMMAENQHELDAVNQEMGSVETRLTKVQRQLMIEELEAGTHIIGLEVQLAKLKPDDPKLVELSRELKATEEKKNAAMSRQREAQDSYEALTTSHREKCSHLTTLIAQQRYLLKEKPELVIGMAAKWDVSALPFETRLALPVSFEFLDAPFDNALQFLTRETGLKFESRPPVEPEEKFIVSEIILGVSGGAILLFLIFIFLRAIKRWSRPRFSLGELCAFTLLLGLAMHGAFRWHGSRQAWKQYRAADEAFNNRGPVVLRVQDMSGELASKWVCVVAGLSLEVDFENQKHVITAK